MSNYPDDIRQYDNHPDSPFFVEPPEPPEPQEWIMGEWRTKEELFGLLNADSRVVFSEEEHEDGYLYIQVKFEEKKD